MGTPNSVRVEFEDSRVRGMPDEPDPVDGPGRSGIALGVAAFAVLGLVIGLVLLRPDEGQAADGLARQAPTSTTPPGSTSSMPSTEEPLPSLRTTNALSIGFRPLSGEIVLTDDGFLALGQSLGDSRLALFRSVDGSEWSEVAVVIDGVDPAEAVAGEQYYSHLARVEDGFAILRTTRLEGAELEGIVERLVSTDGVTWSVDEGFAGVRRTGDVSPVFHFDEVAGVSIVPEDVPIPLAGLFADALVPHSGVDETGICDLESFFTVQSQSTGFRIIPCSTDGVASGAVDPFRITDPDSATMVLDCADVLAQIASRRSTSITLIRGDIIERDRVGLLAAGSFVALSNGSIAGLIDGDERFPGFASCEGFPDALEKPRFSILEWLALDGVTRSLAIPELDEVFEVDAFPLRVMRADGSGVLVLYGSTVWRYELALGEAAVTALRDLPSVELEWDDFAFLDSQRGVGISANSVSVADLGTGNIVTVNMDLGNSPQILYADAELAFVQTGGPDGPLQLIDDLG